MGKGILFLLIILFFFGEHIYSQTPIEITDPRVELRNNRIHISYDILNSDPSEKFSVTLIITDEEENYLNARTLSGDIGDVVNGGSNKEIVWDLEADKIFLNTSIYVKIRVLAIDPPEPVIIVPEKDQAEKDIPDNPKNLSRTGVILQSLVIPGLGLSRVTGKPHWLRGVAGYGSIAASVILNRKAIDTYNQIDDLEDYDDKNEIYEKSMSQDNISEILAYTAIGIWVTDFIWTLVSTSDLKKKSLQSDLSRISLNTDIDPLTYTPMVGIKYRF